MKGETHILFIKPSLLELLDFNLGPPSRSSWCLIVTLSPLGQTKRTLICGELIF